MREGMPATEFVVILEGEIHIRRVGDPYAPVFVRGAGQATGIPFSRIKIIRGRGTGCGPDSPRRLPAAAHFANLFIARPILRKNSSRK